MFSAIVIAAMIATYIAAMQINLAFTMACTAMIAASIAWFAYYGDPPLSDNAAQPMEEDQAAYVAYSIVSQCTALYDIVSCALHRQKKRRLMHAAF